MMKTVITIAGLLIIAVSFVYILKNPKQSLMAALMKKRGKAQEDPQESDSDPSK